MHGVKKEISIPFTFAKNVFNATFSVNRNDFKIGKADADVANAIKIEAAVPVSK